MPKPTIVDACCISRSQWDAIVEDLSEPIGCKCRDYDLEDSHEMASGLLIGFTNSVRIHSCIREGSWVVFGDIYDENETRPTPPGSA